MCYSVESSAKTTLYSFIAIAALLQSRVPHFQWIAMSLVGWCGMQFAELLLWLTNPRNACTTVNKVITLTLIPLVLFLQPFGTILGSFFVKPWGECNQKRKLFIVGYSAIVAFIMFVYFYKDAKKHCTTVTPEGHLHWWLYNFEPEVPTGYITKYYLWLFLVFFPIFMLWNVSFKAIIAISILPLFGFFTGLKTDSSASIWCHYASFTSLVSIVIYLLYKSKVYNILV